MSKDWPILSIGSDPGAHNGISIPVKHVVKVEDHRNGTGCRVHLMGGHIHELHMVSRVRFVAEMCDALDGVGSRTQRPSEMPSN